MANDAAGVSWDITVPTLSDVRSLGQQEIRGLRAGVGLRMSREHTTLAGSSAGGWHRQGSAIPYYQDANPTHKPDASAVLDDDDKGRLHVDTNAQNLLKVYGGLVDGWLNVACTRLSYGTFNSKTDFVDASPYTIDTTFVCNLFIFMPVFNGDQIEQFIVPFFSRNTVTDMVVGREATWWSCDFERSGTDVIVTHGGYSHTASNSPNGMWAAFKFSDE
jgi:hypothetical protein